MKIHTIQIDDGDALLDAVWTSGGGHVEVRVEPDHGGRLVSIHLTADDAQALGEWLTARVPDLRPAPTA